MIFKYNDVHDTYCTDVSLKYLCYAKKKKNLLIIISNNNILIK